MVGQDMNEVRKAFNNEDDASQTMIKSKRDYLYFLV